MIDQIKRKTLTWTRQHSLVRHLVATVCCHGECPTKSNEWSVAALSRQGPCRHDETKRDYRKITIAKFSILFRNFVPEAGINRCSLPVQHPKTLYDFFCRKNVLKVQVFYEELNVELITEERSYEVSIALTFFAVDRVTHLTSLTNARISNLDNTISWQSN